jgi:hypothetical protein
MLRQVTWDESGMTKLKTAICQATRAAYRKYEEITGNWLLHAPEHFLQNFIFLRLGRNDWVYAEATRRKIAEAAGRPARGRPPTRKAARYDLVVWQRTDETRLNAVIEIKRSLRVDANLHKDAERVRRALNGTRGARAGYVLVYSEMRAERGREALLTRFDKWAGELSLRMIHRDILEVEKSEDVDKAPWMSGYCLMRA